MVTGSEERTVKKASWTLLLLSFSPFALAEWIATGPEVPMLVAFDTEMKEIMEELAIPSAQLAVTWKGRLVLARGYSSNPSVSDLIVQPDSVFRIASLTKPITAILIHRLVQDGQLSLDQTIGEFIDLTPLPGETADPRLKNVTVRNLLQHRAGFATSADVGYDPLFLDEYIALRNDVPLPVKAEHIIRYMNGVPLMTDPGYVYDYSNYGYLILNKVIEAASGMSYQNYVDTLMNPIGIWDIKPGRSLESGRYSNEVSYSTGGFTYTTVMDDSGDIVPMEYGGFNMSNLEGVGGFVASSIELARWMANLDQPDAPEALLDANSLEQMFGLPEHYPLPYVPDTYYYSSGWLVADFLDGDRVTYHTGALPGTNTILVRRSDGLNYVVLFNRRNETGEGAGYISVLVSKFNTLLAATEQWPQHDLFPSMLPVIFRGDFDR
jgi:CubicO group peptidase (beta-lactamase class C family)